MFFLRIMKEHALFLALSFPPKNVDLINEAKQFNLYYHTLLKRNLSLATGIINIQDYMVTNYTLEAEKQVATLMGVTIDTDLTVLELNLATQPVKKQWTDELINEVCNLNKEIATVTENFINYKTKVIEAVNNCKVYSSHYPDMLDHLREEAQFYVAHLARCDYRIENHNMEDYLKQELFWNHIMSEHAKYIRGQLDPNENKLIKLANYFSNQYDELASNTLNIMNNDQLAELMTSESDKLTKDFQEYKAQAVEGILQCEIKTIASPLLLDHVLREANYYLHVLEKAS